jgi:hypothetical protein
MDVWIHIFLIATLVGGEWSASHPGRFTPGTYWMGPIVGLDVVEERKLLALQGLEPIPLGSPARSQSLYRLRYPGSPDDGLMSRNILYILHIVVTE